MDEQQLVNAFEEQKPILRAWGHFVEAQISRGLADRGDDATLFSKDSRVKDVESFVNKALYRGKGYSNPIEDIEDKVGVRCMVLLSDGLDKLSAIVENSSSWAWRLDRNHESEKERNPELFGYQSKHYILESTYTSIYEDVEIPAGIKCELQVRTLLQHIYAEISHDSIYKSSYEVTTPAMTRAFSKAMALMEVTDQLLTSVKEEIETVTSGIRKIRTEMELLWTDYKLGNVTTDDRLVCDILNMLMKCYQNIDDDALTSFYGEKTFLIERISEKQESYRLFQQPTILLLYFLANDDVDLLKLEWKNDIRILAPILTDLGLTIH